MPQDQTLFFKCAALAAQTAGNELVCSMQTVGERACLMKALYNKYKHKHKPVVLRSVFFPFSSCSSLETATGERCRGGSQASPPQELSEVMVPSVDGSARQCEGTILNCSSASIR